MMRKMRRLLAGGVVLALMMAPGAAWTATVEFAWTGTVTAVDAGFAASLPPGSGIEVGASAWVIYEFESTTPDANPGDPVEGDYPGALVSWKTQVGAFVFSHDSSGSLNDIYIFLDTAPFTALNIYQAANNVTAMPSLPGGATLEADVAFISYVPGHLASDALLLAPPDPTAWDQASARVFDAAGPTTLIDIDLATVCPSPCQPPEPPPLAAPAPLLPPAAALGLGGLLLLCVAAYRRARCPGGKRWR